MFFTTSGPEVHQGVTVEHIRLYQTTPASCICPTHYFGDAVCEHIVAANQDCSCPATLWMAHPKDGKRLICAEPRCAVSKVRKQSLINCGWQAVPAEASIVRLCTVCEMEIAVHDHHSLASVLYHCYNGQHLIETPCAVCGSPASATHLQGYPVCAVHDLQPVPLPA